MQSNLEALWQPLQSVIFQKAAQHKDILFPVFTNGAYLQSKYLDLFDKNRNLIPIISIEGDEKTTDERRGSGVYSQVTKAMQGVKSRGMIFGTSVTVTTENINEVFSDDFLNGLYDLGCKAVIYVEYVPVTDESIHLVPSEEQEGGCQC